MNKELENFTFDELSLGQQASFNKTLKQEDISLFAVMSGDVNPAHMDPDFAKSDIFHGIVGHGMWSGSLISALLGTVLPGPGTIYLEQDIKSRKPVRIGDNITHELLAAVVPATSNLRTKYHISHAYVMDVPSYHKPLIIDSLRTRLLSCALAVKIVAARKAGKIK